MYKFIYFNWRLITLQYCIGFAIYQNESAIGIYVFPILNPPPLILTFLLNMHIIKQRAQVYSQCSPNVSHKNVFILGL